MDAGVSELEFSQIRHMRSLPSLPDSAHHPDDEIERRSRPPSRHARAGLAEGLEKSTPSLDVLDAPPRPPSDLDLDSACTGHIEALIRQSIQNVGLKDRHWEDILAPLPLAVLSVVDADALHQLSRTQDALYLARTQIAEKLRQEAEASTGKGAKSEKAKTPATPALESLSRAYRREQEQSINTLARHILTQMLKPSVAGSAVTQDKGESPPSEKAGEESPKLVKFLICVSEEVGYTRKAHFEPGVFDGAALFQNDEEEPNEDEKLALGQDDDAHHYIGGTIHLTGPEREWNRIEKLLTLLIFAACHLKLEMHLLRDTLTARPAPPTPPTASSILLDKPIDSAAPLVPPKDSDAGVAPALESPISPTSPTLSNAPFDSKHSRKWSRAGIVNLLFGRGNASTPETTNKLTKRFTNKLKMHRTRSIGRQPNEISRLQPFSPNFRLQIPGSLPMDDWEMVAPDTSVVVEMVKEEEEQSGETLTAPGTPTTEIVSPNLPGGGLLSPAAAVASNPHERFLRVIERMEKAILSVSPDVHYPPPALLVQLREQEKSVQQNELAKVPGRPLLGRVRSFNSITPALSQPDESLPASSASTPFLAACPNPALQPAATDRRISIDTRTGLGSLMTGNNSLDGTLRHQSMPFLIERALINHPPAQPLCVVPTWTTSLFYRAILAQPAILALEAHDVSLSAVLTSLITSMKQSCPAKCGYSLEEHVTSIIHDSHKISLTSKSSIVSSARPDEAVHWYSCQICSKKSSPATMSEASLLYSFSKYLELLIYNERFIPSSEHLCSHVEDPNKITRVLHINGIELHIRVEKLALYELRMPTSVDSSSTDTGPQSSTDSDSAKKEMFLSEVKAFFDSLEACLSASSRESADAAAGQLPGDLQLLIREARLAMEEDPDVDLNQRRRTFMKQAKLLKKEAKSLIRDKSGGDGSTKVQLSEPDYLNSKDMHVLPAGNGVIVRESEISSLIAFTLSSQAYRTYAAVALEQDSPKLGSDQERAVGLPLPESETSSQASTRPPSPTRAGKAGANGEEDWHTVLKIKSRVKPTGSILSLKATSPRLRLQDTFAPLEKSKTSTSSPSTTANTPAKVDEDDKFLEDLLLSVKVPVAGGTTTLKKEKSPALPSLISGLTNKRHVSEASTSSSTSATTAISDVGSLDVQLKHGRAESIKSTSTADTDISESTVHSTESVDTIKGEEPPSRTSPVIQQSPEFDKGTGRGSTFGSLSSFLHRNLRLNQGPSPASSPSTTKGPHIKQTTRHGDIKLSCTVYYAEQFAFLRRACGLPEKLYTDSLSRCQALNFSGGKTNAGFYLTDDKRFVLKEMRTSWNVSELDAMLTFAPQYCDYLLTSKRSSLLTKIFGVYTCKIKDVKTGETRHKVDLVVMEHLFFEQEVSRKFDLKGISSRVAKTKEDGQTLWDADWEELFQNRLLIHAHHKTILREAIAADTDFLAKNNVMDYSALVGVDDKEKTLTIGIIDIIGTFNLAKIVESNSKRILQGERTVIPPDEYAARFRTALEGNFVASPEKWSKSLGKDDEVPILSCPF